MRSTVWQLPSGISFKHASDEQYIASRQPSDAKFDLVVVNYAVNREKALRFAKELLAPGGRVLAPTNLQDNYWFKQEYVFLDEQGKVLWTKGTLWSYDVLFQPDFTNPGCQGQWCPQYRNDDAVRGLRL